MTTFFEVADRASTDRSFLASLLVDPREALETHRIRLESDEDVVELERMLEDAHEHLKVVLRRSGFSSSTVSADWGIGAGCCNSKVFGEASDPAPERASRSK